jgi:hypothetical protein
MLCSLRGPCKVVIRKCSAVYNNSHEVKRRVSRRQPAEIYAWVLQNNSKKGMKLCKEDFMCDLKRQ